MKIQKSQIAVLVLNQSPISAVFTIVRFAGDPKTALTGELLYVFQADSAKQMICWKNNEWQLSGIFSWGLTICGADGLPGVYSKVSHFRYWIDEQVAKVSMFGLTCGSEG